MTENLLQTLLDSANPWPEAPALIFEDQRLSYQQLRETVERLAAGLERLGLVPGDRVGLLLYNQPEYVTSLLAVLGLGATVVPLNTRLTAVEISTILQDAEARYLITSDDFDPVLNRLDAPGLAGILHCGHPGGEPAGCPRYAYEDLITGSQTNPAAFPVCVPPDRVATLVYTSGTTGRPKGVMLSHENLRADVWANLQVIEATAADRFVTVSPLFHVFGQTNVLLTALTVGAAVVLVKKFSPRAIIEAVSRHRVTFLAAVPTQYQMMLSYLEDHPADLSVIRAAIRVCHSGAAALPVELIGRIEQAFGAPVQEGYGLSEATSIVCSNPLHGPRKPGSVGPPIPGVRVRIVDEALSPLPPGKRDAIGELQVRGPTVMLGYHNRPEESRLAFIDGWLKTRDMAYRDEDGYVYIVDRQDDLINVGGVKVYPREIEEVLYQHPAIQAAAVVGQPSSLYHQEIRAYVVPKAGAAVTREDLYRHCTESLAEYKIPKHWTFVANIPQGPTGKILRKALRPPGS